MTDDINIDAKPEEPCTCCDCHHNSEAPEPEIFHHSQIVCPDLTRAYGKETTCIGLRCALCFPIECTLYRDNKEYVQQGICAKVAQTMYLQDLAESTFIISEILDTGLGNMEELQKTMEFAQELNDNTDKDPDGYS